MIPVFIGYDGRETVAYNVLAHSILARSSEPVTIAPLIAEAMRRIAEEHSVSSLFD